MLIRKAVKWSAEASENIIEAGGSPDVVLSQFSGESITTMVRNGLHIVYRKED